MPRYLIYNFSGEVDDLSHLFPNERLAQTAAVLRAQGAEVEIWDRGNIETLGHLAPAGWKRAIASWSGAGIFRKIARNRPVNALDKLLFGLPLRLVSESMTRDIESNYADFMDREARRIADGHFDAVLLNLWQGGFQQSMDMVRTLKESSPTPVYATGQRVDWFGENILHLYPQVDGIILGLGYDAIARLAGGEPFEDLPNVVYRDGSGQIVPNDCTVTEMEGLPHPAYDPATYHGIEHLIPLYHITLSNQACPNRCAFCPRPFNYGRKVRRKPVEEALGEVEALRDRGVRHFRIADSTPPPRLLTDFAGGIVERGLHQRDVHFTAFSRIDQNRREDFDLIREANFEALFFGLETLDDAGLERIRKGITYPEIRETLEVAHEAGIFIVGSVIFPLPGETESSRENTLERLRELAPVLDSVLIQPAGVYPSSDWGINPERYGIELDADYVEALMTYPVKLIIPMRFWPPFPFSYPMMGKDAEEVTFDDIRVAYESFSSRVWRDLDICNVQDYTLLVAQMLGTDPYDFTNRAKKVMATRDYNALREIVKRARRGLHSDARS